jgi:hypothetical protein
MNFARWVYRVAGIYGILVTLPLLVAERQIAIQYPPPLTHAEYFYGFALIVLAWQVAFLVIGNNPLQYRGLMPVTVLEKLPYAVAVTALFVQGRVAGMMLVFAFVDSVWAVLFFVAYVQTGNSWIGLLDEKHTKQFSSREASPSYGGAGSPR